MKTLAARLVILTGVIGLVCVSTDVVSASPNTSFKLQIAAPECTLDTIDDGFGPVQVITCPPGTIDPGDGTTNEETIIINEDGARSVGDDTRVSQRFNSSIDTLALLEVFRDPDLSLDVLDRIGDQQRRTGTDIIPSSGTEESSFIQSVVIPSIVAAVVVASAAYFVTGPRLVKYLFRLFRKP